MSQNTLKFSENQESLSLPDLAERINSEHRQCEAAMQSGLQHALEAGRLLREAKKLCPHGTWLTWLEENFAGSSRAAQSYMQIVDRMDRMEANAQRVADLSYREVLKLISEPAPAPQAEVEPDPLPDLSPDFQYHGMSDDLDYLVEIYPAVQPGYFHVAVFRGLNDGSGEGYVDYFNRGLIYDRKLFIDALENHFHVKPTRWHTEPKGEKPFYLFPEPGRWN
jgi:hypothetical protein